MCCVEFSRWLSSQAAPPRACPWGRATSRALLGLRACANHLKLHRQRARAAARRMSPRGTDRRSRSVAPAPHAIPAMRRPPKSVARRGPLDAPADASRRFPNPDEPRSTHRHPGQGLDQGKKPAPESPLGCPALSPLVSQSSRGVPTWEPPERAGPKRQLGQAREGVPAGDGNRPGQVRRRPVAPAALRVSLPRTDAIAAMARRCVCGSTNVIAPDLLEFPPCMA